MIDVAENIRQMKNELPQSVTLVAVSKFHPTEALMAAYDAGQRVFGESRAQELVQKAAMAFHRASADQQSQDCGPDCDSDT